MVLDDMRNAFSSACDMLGVRDLRIRLRVDFERCLAVSIIVGGIDGWEVEFDNELVQTIAGPRLPRLSSFDRASFVTGPFHPASADRIRRAFDSRHSFRLSPRDRVRVPLTRWSIRVCQNGSPTAIETPAPMNKVAWRRLIAPAKRSLEDDFRFFSTEPSIQFQSNDARGLGLHTLKTFLGTSPVLSRLAR
jgi:hypothetical protein